MYCSNFLNVKKWLLLLEQSNITIRRYNSIPIEQVCKEPPEIQLIHNLKTWLEGGEWTTFWHMKQLLKTTKESDILLPLVIARPKQKNYKINLSGHVDPGGSRMAISKYLGKKTLPFDIIWPKELLHEIDFLSKFNEILSAEQFIEPYENIKINYNVFLCSDMPCETCITNNKIHNSPYRYCVNWSNDWFYSQNQDYCTWYEKNKNFKTEKLMDWYFI